MFHVPAHILSEFALQPMQLDAQHHICINYIEMNELERCINEAKRYWQRINHMQKLFDYLCL